MAKSAGNFERVTELAERGIDPLAFRYLALTSRYRRKLDYSDRVARRGRGRRSSRSARGCAALGPPPADGPWAAPAAAPRGRRAGDRPIGIGRRASPATAAATSLRADRPGPRARRSRSPPDGRALHDRFVAAIDDDLDLPTALAVVRETLRAPICRRRAALAGRSTPTSCSGLDLDRTWSTPHEAADGTAPAEVLALLDERTAARTAKDFARADELRARLAAEGWEVVDGPDGSVVRRAT